MIDWVSTIGTFVVALILSVTFIPLSFLVPNKVMNWYISRDGKWDFMVSMIALVNMVFLGSVVLMSTLKQGPHSIDAMEYNEGYVEFPLMVGITLFLYVWATLNFRLWYLRTIKSPNGVLRKRSDV